MMIIEQRADVIAAAAMGFRIRPYFGPVEANGPDVISYSVVFPNEEAEGESDDLWLSAMDAWDAAARMAPHYEPAPCTHEFQEDSESILVCTHCGLEGPLP